MKHTRSGTSLLASALLLMTGASSAYASCPAKAIVGTWDDQFGSVAKITSTTKGTATASSVVCSVPGTVYKLAINLTGGSPPTTAKVVGKPPKGSSCPVVKATLKYQKGSCTVASGPVKFNGGTIQDTWTKQNASSARTPSRQGGTLTDGLK